MLINEPRARRLMTEAGVDGLLATTFPNMFYLTGVWRPRELFAVASADRLTSPSLVVGTVNADFATQAHAGVTRFFTFGTFYRELGDRERWNEANRALVERVLTRDPFPGHVDAICAAIEEAGLAGGVLAHDERGLEPHDFEEIGRRFPRLRLKPAFQLFRRIRMIKAPEEIRRLRGAAAITEQAIAHTAGLAREGMSQQELRIEIETFQLREGAMTNNMCIGFGPSGAIGDSNVPGDVLKRGSTIRYDVGCISDGYASDLARTYAFGPVDPKVERYYGAILAGEQVMIEAAKPGLRCDELFNLAVEAAREEGIPHYKRHHVGHGLGIGTAGYDMPLIGPNDRTPLEPGMVLMFETPYYELGFAGLQVEDAILITETGCELMTTLSRDIGRIG